MRLNLKTTTQFTKVLAKLSQIWSMWWESIYKIAHVGFFFQNNMTYKKNPHSEDTIYLILH